jgi:hypothetical protein
MKYSHHKKIHREVGRAKDLSAPRQKKGTIVKPIFKMVLVRNTPSVTQDFNDL